MTDKDAVPSLKRELDEDDKFHITDLFHGEIAARLLRMDARIGNICCEFAGPQYRNWILEFKSSRWGLEVVDFEYDEDARSFDLPSSVAIVEQY